METRQGGGTAGQGKKRVDGTAMWMELQGGWNAVLWVVPGVDCKKSGLQERVRTVRLGKESQLRYVGI